MGAGGNHPAYRRVGLCQRTAWTDMPTYQKPFKYRAGYWRDFRVMVHRFRPL
jgi:hypothetical protein